MDDHRGAIMDDDLASEMVRRTWIVSSASCNQSGGAHKVITVLRDVPYPRKLYTVSSFFSSKEGLA